jgi:hypothetical protein
VKSKLVEEKFFLYEVDCIRLFQRRQVLEQLMRKDQKNGTQLLFLE